MRIAINAALAGSHATGIGIYAGALASTLPTVDDGQHSYDIFLGDVSDEDETPTDPARVRRHAIPSHGSARRLLWDNWLVGRAARRCGADVLHSTSSYLPWAPSCPCVLTVHDLAIYRYPEAFRLQNRTMGRRLFELSLRRAAALIAPSEATKRDIVALCGVRPEQVNVIPEAAERQFQPNHDPDELWRVRRRYDLRHPYVLSVATAEPRKNLARLIAAFRALRGALPFECMLVLVGQAGWLNGSLEAEARDLVQAGLLRATGYVPRSDLPLLYAGASAFAYPSLYEGFGLPVLEALACGAPVLTSQCSSLPEVAGDAAVLVDPFSVESIAAGLHTLLTDSALAAELRRRAPVQAASFSWEAAAEATLRVYRLAHEAARRARGAVRPVPATTSGR